MAYISDIDAERARRLRAKWQDPQAQRRRSYSARRSLSHRAML